MTTFIFSDLEPVARLRSAIPETCQPMLDQLFGMVPLPPDQPSCATATATLAKCLVDYAETIANSRPFFFGMGRSRAMHPRQRVNPYASNSGHGAIRTADRAAR